MMENKTKIDLKNKSIFITGVAGFIGSNLAKRLLYKLLVGKYIMNGWGEWIMYAVIASIIVLVTTGLIYFITEKKQFFSYNCKAQFVHIKIFRLFIIRNDNRHMMNRRQFHYLYASLFYMYHACRSITAASSRSTITLPTTCGIIKITNPPISI